MNLFDNNGRYAKNAEIVNSAYSENEYYKNCYFLEFLYWVNLIKNYKTAFDQDLLNPDIKKSLGITKLLLEDKDNQKEMYKILDAYDLSLVKIIERETKHDIAAVKTLLKQKISDFLSIKLDSSRIYSICDLVHFNLTSQDIVGVVQTKMFKDTLYDIINTNMSKVHESVESMSKDEYMLGRTHGQVAVPIKIKDLMSRYLTTNGLEEYFENFGNTKIQFGNGTIGNNYSAKLLGFNGYEVSKDTLIQYFYNTSTKDFQIKPHFQSNKYEGILDSFNDLSKIMYQLLNFTQDMWYYCSINYLVRKTGDNEFGSSTMPQKINPISLENAEGNLKLAIGMLDTLRSSLSLSRLQRDLSDLTVVRNLPLLLCYFNQALCSLNQGLEQYEFNSKAISEDLNSNYQFASEVGQLYGIMSNEPESYLSMKLMSKDNVQWDLEYLKENFDNYFSNNVLSELITREHENLPTKSN